MNITIGSRLSCPSCGLQVVLTRAAQASVDITCGGELLQMGDSRRIAESAGPTEAPGVQLGKRYADPVSGIELLCVSAGSGPLAVDGRDLDLKVAKPLPSSD